MSRPLRPLELTAVAAAALLAVVLGVRTVSAPDLGYHLAYGHELLTAGRIVDHNPYVYTLPHGAERPEPGPGSWYDDDGRYRFVNANWLSQLVMASANRVGGVTGLGLLRLALVGGLFTLLALTLRDLGTGRLGTALGLLLFALVAYPRLELRVELFGYAGLALIWWLLARSWPEWRPGWGTVTLVVAAQAVLVNLHSYFLLGVLLTAGLLAGRLADLALTPPSADAHGGVRQSVVRLGAALAGQLAATLANPWGWRGALLPIETLLFIRANDIAGAPGESSHPWALIGDFHPPFTIPAAWTTTYTWASIALLVLAGIGAVGLLVARRLPALAVLAGMGAIGLSMARNLVPAGLFLTPLGVAGGTALLERFGRRTAAVRPRLRAAAAVLIAVTAVVATAMVVTQRFYFRHGEGSSGRFGMGWSRLEVPLDAVEWFNLHQPEGRLWTDYIGSSWWHWLTAPRRDVPVLTNTWAYPPAVLERAMTLCREPGADAAAFNREMDALGVEVVALRDDWCPLLVRRLAADERWAPVHVSGRTVVFVDRDGPNRALAETASLDRAPFDSAAELARVGGMDPVPRAAWLAHGVSLLDLGRVGPALAFFARALEDDPDDPTARRLWAGAETVRAADLDRAGDAAAVPSARAAVTVLEGLVREDPHDPAARQNLAGARAVLARALEHEGDRRVEAGEVDAAVSVWTEALTALDQAGPVAGPTDPRAPALAGLHARLGVARGRRGDALAQQGSPAARAEWMAATRHLERAVALQPGNPGTLQLLQALRARLQPQSTQPRR